MRVFAILATVILIALTCVACVRAESLSQAPDGHLILNCTFDYLKAGESRKYYVRQSPSAAGYNVVWESGNENVATVDGSGIVYALAAGETTISVSAENKPYKAVMKLTVADEIVRKEDGEEALQQTVDKMKNVGSVLIVGGYYPSLSVDGQLTLYGAEGAEIGDVEIAENGRLFMYSVKIGAYFPSTSEACVVTGKNAGFTAVGCSFEYKDAESGNRASCAVKAPSDAAEIYCRACSFSGYKDCVSIGATDGEIYLVNNDFSECDSAVCIDLRTGNGKEDKNATGKISDNVYTGCGECVNLYYNAPTYTGSLDIKDADIGVPSCKLLANT